MVCVCGCVPLSIPGNTAAADAVEGAGEAGAVVGVAATVVNASGGAAIAVCVCACVRVCECHVRML